MEIQITKREERRRKDSPSGRGKTEGETEAEAETLNGVEEQRPPHTPGREQRDETPHIEPERLRLPQNAEAKQDETGTQNTVKRFFRAADKMLAEKEDKAIHPSRAEFVIHAERIPKRSHSAETVQGTPDKEGKETDLNKGKKG